ncbi:MAG TPA: sensor histidine kinase KdpD [Polyangiaceae bacterium]|nr:sensor histidine kinase KdpD [Polyangiaceae bacterium]
MTDDDKRPDPEALLKRIRAESAREGRAKLRVYLGYAPGVGKTFAMLSAARDLTNTDVVVGVVETHGRYDTAAMVLGLEVLPRRSIEYRGRTLEEFDLDAALRRKPKVILVDELAHTNAAGARHAKRWQDVLDLLDAGIDVHTTMNVQHIESLNDVIAQITQVRVRETVPDSVLARADEIELIDVPPEELLKRLKDGKVYLSEQAARAVDNFFRRGNLLALRELALRRVADRVDQEVLAHRAEHEIGATWPTQERIVVCVGPSPASSRLVRATARMAAGLRAPWVAAYVEPTAVAPMTDADRGRLETHLKLAESLGAEIVRLTGEKISVALLSYASKHNVTRLVIGKPTHSRLRDLLRGSLLDEVVRGSGAIDVHVISGDAGQTEGTAEPMPVASTPLDPREYAVTASLVLGATALGGAAQRFLALPDLIAIYLLVIMIVAARYGRGASVLASVLSVAAYDFFFIPPFHTFAVTDVRHMLTFLLMFGVGLFISGLTFRIRRGEQEARAREAETAALYALSRDVGAAVDERGIGEAAAKHAAGLFATATGVAVKNAQGVPVLLAETGPVPFEEPERAVAEWVFEHGSPAGLGTDTLPGAKITCLPIGIAGDTIAVLAVAARSGAVTAMDDRHFRDAYLRQAALALGRARLAEDAKASALRARTEEMRSSLLSAVSHDLRTPLAAITGAATTLRDGSSALTPAQSRELEEMICEEAERLERLVGNLLDMTRLESGAVTVKRDWVPLEELVSSARARAEKRLGDRAVEVDIAEDVPLLHVDPILFEQVLLNLLENAGKYTPPGSPVAVLARRRGAGVTVEVADRGPGLPPGAEAHVFEKFYRGPNAGTSGVGLGLPICRGIVEAHGGTLTAANRQGGGAVFRIELPPQASSPPIPVEADGADLASAPA